MSRWIKSLGKAQKVVIGLVLLAIAAGLVVWQLHPVTFMLFLVLGIPGLLFLTDVLLRS
jgi:hypothetical protein